MPDSIKYAHTLTHCFKTKTGSVVCPKGFILWGKHLNVAKVLGFNAEQRYCGPLNAACSQISSQFAHLQPNISTEIEDLFSNI